MARLAAAAAALALTTGAAAAQYQLVTIGTAGVTGVYYPAGGAICRMVNEHRKEHGVRCAVESTEGSVYNLRTLRAGELDFGIIQSDVQADAVAASGRFADDGPFDELRAVFSLHVEPMQVMVRADAGIGDVADLKGKRVNIGNPGSGTRVLAELLMSAAGLSPADFAETGELKSILQAAALCDDTMDAVIWAAGLPNGSTEEATRNCDVRILALEGAWVDKLVADNPAYIRAAVPGGMYQGNPDDVATYGPRATLVTTAATSDEVVYTLVRSVFDNLGAFKSLHPAFQPLTEEEMVSEGLTAPLHPGAIKYFAERGWM